MPPRVPPSAVEEKKALSWCRFDPPCTSFCVAALEAFTAPRCLAENGCDFARNCAEGEHCRQNTCHNHGECESTPPCPNLQVLAEHGTKPQGTECSKVRNCAATLACNDKYNECNQAESCLYAQATCAQGLDWEGNKSIREHKNLEPSVPRIGLAFSGGGIRSATFNLGVLQGLQQMGLLRYVQYLSTVSGGGYIGSFLVSAYHRAADRTQDEHADPHELDALHPTSAEVRHLRQYSRYLAPQPGLLSADTWTIITTWMRNTLLIQFEVVLSLALVLLLPRILHNSAAVMDGGLSESPWLWVLSSLVGAGLLATGLYWALDQLDLVQRHTPGDTSTEVVKEIALPIFGAAFFAALANWPMVLHERTLVHRMMTLTTFDALRTHTSRWDLIAHLSPIVMMVAFCWFLIHRLHSIKATDAPARIRWLAIFLPGILGGMAFVGLAVIPEVMDLQGRAFAASWGLTAWWPLIGPSTVLMTFSLMLVLLLGILGRDMPDSQREWWSRLGAWLLILASSMLVLSLISLQAPPVVVRLWNGWDHWDWFKSGVSGWLASTLAAVWAGNSKKTGSKKDTTAPTNGWRDLLASMGPFLYIAGLLIGISIALEWIVVAVAGAISGRIGDPGNYWELLAAVLLFPAIFAMAYLAWKRFDLNEFSMHHFYRNRLVRAYMGATNRLRDPNQFTGFDFTDDMKLARVTNPSGPSSETYSLSNRGIYRGPFPIVNAALNSQGANLDEQDRRARNFVFTPLYSGFDGARLGNPLADGKNNLQRSNLPAYRPTANYIDKSSSTRLGGIKYGTAVAISGAAASPNMGYHTSPAVAFLLTMFNVRLGWWVPNPADDKWQSPGPKLQLWNLTKELFGNANLKDPYVYVSDGGHFENLGVYELVRRRCKIIIACDAEEDGKYEFQGLASLIRKCRIDFNVRIDIKAKNIRPPEDGLSDSHFAIGRIQYPDGLSGHLIYLKSSMTGDESEDILQYKKTMPDFPHESTGDQFFTEDQFESYRALGKHVALASLESPSLNAQLDDVLMEVADYGLVERDVRSLLAGPAGENLSRHQLIEKRLRGKRELADVPEEKLTALIGKIQNLMNRRKYWDQLITELTQLKESSTESEVFTRHSDSLMALWGRLASDPELSYLDSELFPDWRNQSSGGLPGAMSDGTARKAFYHTQQMLQLMENVFMDLDLERNWRKPDNAGWRELFSKWGASQTLRSAWDQTSGTYSERFQEFCANRHIFK